MTCIELADLRYVDIKTYDRGASERELNRQRQADTTESDNANVHTSTLSSLALTGKLGSIFTAGVLVDTSGSSNRSSRPIISLKHIYRNKVSR